MDKSLIRSESFLGNIKTIIGDKSSDIVLETLGKVYIKIDGNWVKAKKAYLKYNNNWNISKNP